MHLLHVNFKLLVSSVKISFVNMDKGIINPCSIVTFFFFLILDVPGLNVPAVVLH